MIPKGYTIGKLGVRVFPENRRQRGSGMVIAVSFTGIETSRHRESRGVSCQMQAYSFLRTADFHDSPFGKRCEVVN